MKQDRCDNFHFCIYCDHCGKPVCGDTDFNQIQTCASDVFDRVRLSHCSHCILKIGNIHRESTYLETIGCSIRNYHRLLCLVADLERDTEKGKYKQNILWAKFTNEFRGKKRVERNLTDPEIWLIISDIVCRRNKILRKNYFITRDASIRMRACLSYIARKHTTVV